MTQSIPEAQEQEINGGVWREAIAHELQLVEDLLRSVINSPVPRLLQASSNLLEGGGKRLRPSLVLLWAKATLMPGVAWNEERAVAVSAATELLHMATLMHDDVIDSSNLRRGRRTANASWGNKFSVLTGDYVLARAFELLIPNASMEILNALAGVTTRMTESEALEVINEGDVEGWRRDYWTIIGGKTAAFMEVCCEVGGILADAGSEQRAAAAQYGAALGLAFQITDDLLDLTGRSSATGKPIGNDLKDGKVTIPVLLTLDAAGEQEKRRITKMIASRNLSDADITYIRSVAESTGAVDGARSLAAEHSARAVAALSPLPDSPAKDALRDLAERVVRRSS